MIKFLIYFTISFAILAIPTSNEATLFDGLNTHLKPYTAKFYRKAAFYIETSLSEGKEITNNLINNTSKKVDFVKNKSSAVKKTDEANAKESFQGIPPSDDYTNEEREALLEVFRNAK